MLRQATVLPTHGLASLSLKDLPDSSIGDAPNA